MLNIACLNPRKQYSISHGQLQLNDSADFITVSDLETCTVEDVYVKGKLMAQNGKALFETKKVEIVNNFRAKKITEADLTVRALSETIAVIEALDGQLITNAVLSKARILDGHVIADAKNDILKIVVINRYQAAAPAIGFVKGFGLKAGAIAVSYTHLDVYKRQGYMGYLIHLDILRIVQQRSRGPWCGSLMVLCLL